MGIGSVDESRASALRDMDILTGAQIGAPEDYEPLFVINLCAAMTPLNLDNGIPGLEQYKLYQVSRIEDGRRRYRLRLGFFTSESMAEDALSSVRQRYATAFTSCLCDEDLKHASGYLKRSVQDLMRTGRFTLPKPRDPNATGMMKGLTPVAAVPAPATRTPVVPIVAPIIAPVVAAIQATKPTPSRHGAQEDTVIKKALVAAQPAQQPAMSVKPSATAAVKPPVAHSTADEEIVEIDFAPAPRFTPNATQPVNAQMMATGRQSLMQQAHAMATTDAAVRAKVIAALTPASAPVRPASSAPAHLATASQKAIVKPTPPPAAPPAPPRASVTPTVIATPSSPAVPVAPAEWTAVTPPLSPKAASKPSQPFHVGAGVDIPETSLSLEAPTAKPVSTPVAAITQPAMQSVAANAVTPDLMRVRELAKQSSQWRQQHGEVPTLDTTQTIRTLSKNEIEDGSREKWFTVQLAISDQPANLDTMPRLDIFEAYSLYSVAAMDDGRIRHALRLGFFREEVSAEAVMGYLRTFFHEPVITRIADAEYERFKDTPRGSALLKPASSVIELEQKRAVKPAESAPIPTVNTVARPVASKPVPRAAAPATKRGATTTKKPAAQKQKAKPARSLQQDLLSEAKLLGLTDTQVLRVQKNPSLLSRLVGKLTK